MQPYTFLQTLKSCERSGILLPRTALSHETRLACYAAEIIVSRPPVQETKTDTLIGFEYPTLKGK